MPTILHQVGINYSKFKLNGESLIKILENKEKKERVCISYLPNGFVAFIPRKISIVQGDNKLILNDPYSKEAYKYFDPPPPPIEKLELYSLKDDPFEKMNLSFKKAELIQFLMKKLEDVNKKARRFKGGQKIIIEEELRERLKALGYLK